MVHRYIIKKTQLVRRLHMSEYDREHFVTDFIQRTLKNLEEINKIAESDSNTEAKAYEVTQLINSILGLIIVPFEKYSDVMDKGLQGDGFDKMVVSMGNIRLYTNYPTDRNNHGELRVFNFIRHLRNAFAHLGNDRVIFLSENKKLSGLLVYDTTYDEKNDKTYKFCAELDLPSFKEIVKNIISIYTKLDKEWEPSAKSSERIDELMELINRGH